MSLINSYHIANCPHRIPFAESESEPPEHSQTQGTGTTGFAASELHALRLFTEKDCPSTPRLLDHKEDRQGPEGLVPGGFFVYLLMNKLPGYRLGARYWDLDNDERTKIREEFKIAWM